MKLRIVFFCIIFPIFSYSQNVVKVVKNYALINAESNIGKIGDTIDIYRTTGNTEKKVGIVEIIKYKNGKCATKILKGDIKVCDHLKIKEDFNIDYLFNDDTETESLTKNNRTTKFGLSGSFFFPSGDMSDVYTISPTISAVLTLPIYKNHDTIFEVVYPFIRLNDDYQAMFDYAEVKVKTSLFMILLYDRYRLDARSFLDCGAGIYFPSVTASRYAESDNVSSTRVGICIGLTVYLDSKKSNICVFGKFHTYFADGTRVEFFTTGLQIFI